MPREPIIKSSPRGGVAPNLRNYEQARAAFSWEEARSELDGLPGGGGLNIAQVFDDFWNYNRLCPKRARVIEVRIQTHYLVTCFQKHRDQNCPDITSVSRN